MNLIIQSIHHCTLRKESHNLARGYRYLKYYSGENSLKLFFCLNYKIFYGLFKVINSGYHTLYMTCDDECELWIQDIGDLQDSRGDKPESKMLITLRRKQNLAPLERER